MEVDGRIHNEDAKIVDLVREHLQTNKKPEWEGRVEVESRKGKRYAPCSSRICFMRSEV
jgi:hypothetical protein